MPVGVCVKASAIRPAYDNLREYTADPHNVLVCRRGRVWITEKPSGKKTLFHWKDSKWANPFALKQYTRQEALGKYREHLSKLLSDPVTKTEFLELRNAHRIGCFCDKNDECHRGIIIEQLQALTKPINTK